MRQRLPWVWTAIIGLMTCWLIVAYDGTVMEALADSGGYWMFPVLFTAMGALITSRIPGNRIGWLLIYIGAGVTLDGAVGSTFHPSGPSEVVSGTDFAALIWLNFGWFLVLIFPLILFLFIFPTGRILGPRWRPGLWLLWVAAAATLAFAVFQSELPSPVADWQVANPIGFLDPGGVLALQVVLAVGLFGSMISGVASMVVRYRRASDEVRAQLKWVMLALIILMLSLSARLTFEQWQGGAVFDALITASIAFVPVSVAIAVVKYRLFEINRVLSRTIGYGLVIGVLALVYAAGAVWLPSRLVDDQAPIFVAASTLAVAALFNPVRRRVLGWVDRRFFRSRYDSERVVEEMLNRLKDETSIEELADQTLSVVAETLHPVSAGIWLRDSPENALPA